MKKIVLLTVLLLTVSISFAQAGSKFITDKVGDITLHTYQSGDPLGDVSFIIESANSLFIGSHMPGRGETSDLEFRIKYLETLTTITAKTDQAAEIEFLMEKAFPGYAGKENLKAISEKL